jgi:hypothetical protein
MTSGLVSSNSNSNSSSHPRYHPVQPEHQAAADRQSSVGCSAHAQDRPQFTRPVTAATVQHRSAVTAPEFLTPQQAAHAGDVVTGSSTGSSRGIGGNSSSSSNTGTSPLLLGATRVRFCCPGCLQPDVIVGKHPCQPPHLPTSPCHTHMLVVKHVLCRRRR